MYRFKIGQHFLLERLSKESASGAAGAAGAGAGATTATAAGIEGANDTNTSTSEALESAASLSGVVTDQLVRIISFNDVFNSKCLSSLRTWYDYLVR